MNNYTCELRQLLPKYAIIHICHQFLIKIKLNKKGNTFFNGVAVITNSMKFWYPSLICNPSVFLDSFLLSGRNSLSGFMPPIVWNLQS